MSWKVLKCSTFEWDCSWTIDWILCGFDTVVANRIDQSIVSFSGQSLSIFRPGFSPKMIQVFNKWMDCDGVPLLAYIAACFEVLTASEKLLYPLIIQTQWHGTKGSGLKKYRNASKCKFSANSWHYWQNPSGLLSNETEFLVFFGLW